jgi:serine/threonine protein kinase
MSSVFGSTKRSQSTGEAFLYGDKIMEFFHVLKACETHSIPSFAVAAIPDTRGTLEHPRVQAPLDGGLTTQVIRHSMVNGIKQAQEEGTAVAVKIFGAGQADTAAKRARARFAGFGAIMREIRVLCHSSLRNHPNIAQLAFVGWQEEQPFPLLGMDMGRLGSLDSVMVSGSQYLTPRLRRHLTADIVVGLHAIHSAGLTHGNLNPDNVLIMDHPDEERCVIAKLADFGGTFQSLVDPGGKPMRYTPTWSAPEVVNGDKAVDWEKADVYSFGLLVASLWLCPSEGGGFHNGGAAPTSCFLSEYVDAESEANDIADALWVLKSVPANSPFGLITRLKSKLAAAGRDRKEMEQLTWKVLEPALRTNFWERSGSKDLVRNMDFYLDWAGRDIRQVSVPLYF